ncbi:hypothetical protein B0T20DRAFT_399538 [Sordaria brevicollis]|uniref:Secreted protein n=1 Tax=Sordaria brevicollis TaxID=83679 RepID=A0AAE0PMV5_SORBR|nr:hypothetical protein B0T20DRAFT_399538 [Sordaria brevicollis]
MKLSQRRPSNRPRIFLVFLRVSLHVLHQAQHQRQRQEKKPPPRKWKCRSVHCPSVRTTFHLFSCQLHWLAQRPCSSRLPKTTLAELEETASEKLHPVNCAVRRFNVEIRRIEKCDTQT